MLHSLVEDRANSHMAHDQKSPNRSAPLQAPRVRICPRRDFEGPQVVVGSRLQFSIQHRENNYLLPSDSEAPCLEGHRASDCAARASRWTHCFPSYDDTIRICDPISSTEVTHFNGHGGPVNALCLFADGRLGQAPMIRQPGYGNWNVAERPSSFTGTSEPSAGFMRFLGEGWFQSPPTIQPGYGNSIAALNYLCTIQAQITALCRLEKGRLASACGVFFSSSDVIRLMGSRKRAETALLRATVFRSQFCNSLL